MSVCPAAYSEPNTALLTFWQIPRLLIFVYRCCVFFPHLVFTLKTTVVLTAVEESLGTVSHNDSYNIYSSLNINGELIRIQ